MKLSIDLCDPTISAILWFIIKYVMNIFRKKEQIYNEMLFSSLQIFIHSIIMQIIKKEIENHKNKKLMINFKG